MSTESSSLRVHSFVERLKQFNSLYDEDLKKIDIQDNLTFSKRKLWGIGGRIYSKFRYFPHWHGLELLGIENLKKSIETCADFLKTNPHLIQDEDLAQIFAGALRKMVFRSSFYKNKCSKLVDDNRIIIEKCNKLRSFILKEAPYQWHSSGRSYYNYATQFYFMGEEYPAAVWKNEAKYLLSYISYNSHNIQDVQSNLEIVKKIFSLSIAPNDVLELGNECLFGIYLHPNKIKGSREFIKAVFVPFGRLYNKQGLLFNKIEEHWREKLKKADLLSLQEMLNLFYEEVERMHEFCFFIKHDLKPSVLNRFLFMKCTFIAKILVSYPEIPQTSSNNNKIARLFLALGEHRYIEDVLYFWKRKKVDSDLAVLVQRFFDEYLFSTGSNPSFVFWKRLIDCHSRSPENFIKTFFHDINLKDPHFSQTLIEKCHLKTFPRFLLRHYFSNEAENCRIAFAKFISEADRDTSKEIADELQKVFDETHFNKNFFTEELPLIVSLFQIFQEGKNEILKNGCLVIFSKTLLYYFGFYPKMTKFPIRWEQNREDRYLPLLHFSNEIFEKILVKFDKRVLEETSTPCFNVDYFPNLTSKGIELLVKIFPTIILLNAYKNPRVSDIKIKCAGISSENKNLLDSYLNSEVVIRHSNYFAGLLGGGFQESQTAKLKSVVTIELTPEMYLFFNRWGQYFYSNKFVEDSRGVNLKHLEIADYFRMESFLPKLDDFFAAQLSNMNENEIFETIRDFFDDRKQEGKTRYLRKLFIRKFPVKKSKSFKTITSFLRKTDLKKMRVSDTRESNLS